MKLTMHAMSNSKLAVSISSKFTGPLAKIVVVQLKGTAEMSITLSTLTLYWYLRWMSK